MSSSKHTFGSLFAGVGGFDMGFEQAGWDCRFQVEWDKHCQSILNRHWPSVPKWGDVSTVSGHELPIVDCIIFGSPCQDLSVAGKRAGLDGERSGLFHEAMRIIKEMRDATNGTFPRWIVWENVAGALSSNKGLDFGRVLDEMAEAGAVAAEWAVLDAQHFGVPQRRRRVFVVACFDPATADRCPDPLLPVSESLRGDSAKGRKKGKTTTSEIGESIASSGGQPFTSTSHAQYGEGIGTIRANGGDLGGGSETLLVEPVLSFDTQFGSNADVFSDLAPPLKASQQSPSIHVSAYDEYNDRLGGEIHHSLRAGTKQSTGVMADMAVRRLTPVECERLMGWPDDHTRWTADGKEQSDTHRYKQCGNGVATPVARWIAEHMRRVDETH